MISIINNKIDGCKQWVEFSEEGKITKSFRCTKGQYCIECDYELKGMKKILQDEWNWIKLGIAPRDQEIMKRFNEIEECLDILKSGGVE